MLNRSEAISRLDNGLREDMTLVLSHPLHVMVNDVDEFGVLLLSDHDAAVVHADSLFPDFIPCYSWYGPYVRLIFGLRVDPVSLQHAFVALDAEFNFFHHLGSSLSEAIWSFLLICEYGSGQFESAEDKRINSMIRMRAASQLPFARTYESVAQVPKDVLKDVDPSYFLYGSHGFGGALRECLWRTVPAFCLESAPELWSSGRVTDAIERWRLARSLSPDPHALWPLLAIQAEPIDQIPLLLTECDWAYAPETPPWGLQAWRCSAMSMKDAWGHMQHLKDFDPVVQQSFDAAQAIVQARKAMGQGEFKKAWCLASFVGSCAAADLAYFDFLVQTQSDILSRHGWGCMAIDR